MRSGIARQSRINKVSAQPNKGDKMMMTQTTSPSMIHAHIWIMVYGDESVRGAHVCACSLAFRLDKQTMQKNALQLQKITCSYNKRALEAKCFG